jgi:hypothetical protein
MRQVGALLDAGAVHGGRTARHHLLALAQTNGIGRRWVDEVPAYWARWRRRRMAACRSILVPRLLSRIGPLARPAVARSMARPTAGAAGPGRSWCPCRAAAQRSPDQQRRHQRPGLAPVGQAGHNLPLGGELVRQRREPGTARQRASIKRAAPVGSGTRRFRAGPAAIRITSPDRARHHRRVDAGRIRTSAVLLASIDHGFGV